MEILSNTRWYLKKPHEHKDTQRENESLNYCNTMHIKNISNTIVRLKQTQIQWIEKKIIYFILAQQRQRRHRRLFLQY